MEAVAGERDAALHAGLEAPLRQERQSSCWSRQVEGAQGAKDQPDGLLEGALGGGRDDQEWG